MVVAGSVSKDICDLRDLGVTAYFSILSEPLSLQEAMVGSAMLLEKQMTQVLRLFKLAKS